MTDVFRQPDILTERETLDAILGGKSIGRVGDGELNILAGRSIKSQDRDPRLSEMMKLVLRESGKGNFLAGIAREDRRSPKPDHAEACWRPRYAAHYTASLYGSAYITRPDCAPWINEPDYWAAVESLWRDRDVVLVRGSTKSLTADGMQGIARTVLEIVADRKNAFAQYSDILRRIKAEGARRRVLLCLGPTATALAYELCQRGEHAVDAGHVAMFMRRWAKARAV